ncbi:MAG: glycoside hydrolase, partial [Anaerolineae bacterium]|nr:glycoside hydrolase [Anaerolineae bacterium]
MSLFYKPDDGVAADFIPFFWKGEFHLFYLKDYRDKANHGEGTPWFHLSTRDFVHFTDYGEALPRGGLNEQDLYVFTGCVFEHGGTFHIFYTGHNPHLRAAGKPEQAIMHATSPDLITWTKDPANPILFADPARYEPHDWRDPFIFLNEETREFWMLLAAREKSGPI